MARCIADYKHKITIQELTGAADAHGHIDNTADASWSAYESAYASVQSKGGREFWKVDQVNAEVSHVWRCPWSTKLAAATPDMRLKYEGVVYQIFSVIDVDMEHREVEIQTKRAV